MYKVNVDSRFIYIDFEDIGTDSPITELLCHLK